MAACPCISQLTLPTLNARKAARAAKAAAPDTTGKPWFDMPAPKITDEVKRDLQMLRLRCTFVCILGACWSRGGGAGGGSAPLGRDVVALVRVRHQAAGIGAVQVWLCTAQV